MNIDAVSNMRYGDITGLRDFFLVHWMVHLEIDAALVKKGSASLPNAALDSEAALSAWVGAMTSGKNPTDDDFIAIMDWLQLHANLHDMEYSALGYGDAPDFSELDLTNSNEFYTWMFAHAAVHDLLGQALSIS